jgi:anthranilate phosphoribosyltransferase
MSHRLPEFIARLVRREDLSRDEAEQLLESLLDAEATDAQIAAALVALAAKGETVEELTGMAAGQRSRVSRIEARHP